MKKGLRSLVTLSVCALSLASCASKVSFAEFQSKAGEAVKKTVEYTTATVSGSATASSSDSKSEKKISANLKVDGHIITPASLSDTAYALTPLVSLPTLLPNKRAIPIMPGDPSRSLMKPRMMKETNPLLPSNGMNSD